MKITTKIALLFAAVVLSCYMADIIRPKMAAGTWGYSAFRFQPDSSYRLLNEKVQLNFVTVNTSGGVNTHRITLVFNKLPIADGDYKIVDFISADSEASVHVADGSPGFSYISKAERPNYIHVYFKDKQCYYWANDVSMKCRPTSGPCTLDSFFVSFHLKELR